MSPSSPPSVQSEVTMCTDFCQITTILDVTLIFFRSKNKCSFFFFYLPPSQVFRGRFIFTTNDRLEQRWMWVAWSATVHSAGRRGSSETATLWLRTLNSELWGKSKNGTKKWDWFCEEPSEERRLLPGSSVAADASISIEGVQIWESADVTPQCNCRQKKQNKSQFVHAAEDVFCSCDFHGPS